MFHVKHFAPKNQFFLQKKTKNVSRETVKVHFLHKIKIFSKKPHKVFHKEKYKNVSRETSCVQNTKCFIKKHFQR